MLIHSLVRSSLHVAGPFPLKLVWELLRSGMTWQCTMMTIHLHHDIMQNLLAAHGLTGCDTVATYFGIGKPITVLKLLGNTMHNLDALGNTNNSLDDAINQAVPFVLSCYGQSACQTMT
jgi:predicted small secreted protein